MFGNASSQMPTLASPKALKRDIASSLRPLEQRIKMRDMLARSASAGNSLMVPLPKTTRVFGFKYTNRSSMRILPAGLDEAHKPKDIRGRSYILSGFNTKAPQQCWKD